MYTVPGFDELAQTLQGSWSDHFKVLPPKTSGRNGILTGTMLYTKTAASGRKYDDQISFMGPPCTLLPPIRDGIVMYPKVTLNLNRKDNKTDDNDPKDKAYADERTAFVAFVKEVEQQTLAKVQEDPKAFFGKEIKPANVFVKDSFVEPEEDNYRTKFTCKVDLKDEAQGIRENIDWTLIRIDVHDVKMGEEDNEVHWTPLTLEDISGRDKILPIFRSAYPYFDTAKNHRTGEIEGYLKIQWCLSGLQRIEKVVDPKRRRDDDDDAVNPAWMKKIKQYMANDDDDTAHTTTTTNAVDAVDAAHASTADESQAVATSNTFNNNSNEQSNILHRKNSEVSVEA